MEWERAKNIILIAFVVLNLGLFGLLRLEDRRYTLSGERIGNINAVLSENNISLYTHPIRRFAPMRHLEISGFYYDIPALLEIFFEETDRVFQAETTEGNFFFETETATLEISNGFITFDNRLDLGENEPVAVPRHEAVEIAGEFIEKHFPDFVVDIIFDDFDGVQIVYLQEYRGNLIYTNFISVLVSSRGIELIEMQFGRVLGYGVDSRMIFAVDEILLTFMQRMRHFAADNPIFINSIDIVYMKEYSSDRIGSVHTAVPFYRIFIRDTDVPFLINAYTNVISE